MRNIRTYLTPSRITGILFILLCVLGYAATSFQITHNFLAASPTNYFTLLSQAVLNGRLDILPQTSTHDLTLWAGRWYLYWGPSPLLLVLPFVAFPRLFASDVWQTLLAGILSAIAFGFLVRAFVRTFSLSITSSAEAAIILSFAFASPNFYLSLAGGIWGMSQVIAVLFLLLSLLALLRQIRTNSFYAFAASVGFFALAVLARLTLVPYGILLLYPILQALRLPNRIRAVRLALILALGAILTLSVFALYNYARFGNLSETGWRNHQSAPRYADIRSGGPILSPSFFVRNAYYYFLNPLVRPTPPYLQVDPEGNSIFAVYPLTLLIFALPFLWSAFRRREQILTGTLLAISGGLLLFFSFFVLTGWSQFGARYFLDVAPAYFLALLPIAARTPRILLALMVILGIGINLWGSLSFYGVIS